ncbi:inositol monophosphatase family protein [Acidiphilium acidophilum]|uniref:3'(2'),5'-bisphosphate nucleotidase n=1 Tax=Acidiphilium acidophilum TaxID=76588 RepID=A0AAW9DW52_ACIAO|nr:inositol monophosphatase family protein [Acidiphilium acidophilum]MDX5932836.1 inositol monophosphatase family protein [Acidiphilium acidophilum]
MSTLPAGAIEAAIAAAEAAGTVIRPYFRAGLTADDKSDDSPVTLADRAAEQAIRAIMAARFPQFGVIGEEFGDQRSGRYNWVIDPIDGTREFITGRPTFVTLIALVEDGVPILGLIDQPVIGERWLAAEGRLDFTSRFGGRIGCRKRARLDQAELSCTGPEWFDEPQLAAFHRLEAACRRASWGDDAYAAGLVALGEIDVIAEAGHKPWDWAASVPIVAAAGGTMCDWSGNPLHLDAEHDGTVLILGDPGLKGAALAALCASPC